MRSLTVVSAATVAVFARPCAAAPEDRGPRGLYLAGGPSLLVGRATDDAGDDTPTYTGVVGRLRIGEEALPGLALGLELVGGAAAGEGFDAALGGFLLQVGWRPFGPDDPLVLWGGTGFGGGDIAADGDAVDGGAAGGSIHSLAVAWELALWGGESDGGRLTPVVSWLFVPQSFGGGVGFNALHLGVELTWYAGR